MRKSLALKSLLRSPLKTLLTFLLIAAASFALFSRVTDYAVTTRETENAKSLYHAVASLDNEVPDVWIETKAVQSADGWAMTGYGIDYEMEDKPWPSKGELEEFSSLPGVTLADTRYMTAGLVGDYKRLMGCSYFLFEGTYNGYIDDKDVSVLEDHVRLKFDDVKVISGEEWLAAGASVTMEDVPLGDVPYAKSSCTRAFYDSLKKGSRCLVYAGTNAEGGAESGIYFRYEKGTDALCVIDNLPGNYLEMESFARQKGWKEAIDYNMRVYDVLYTSDMRAIPKFNDQRVSIVKGRSLTVEDTDACVVSKEFLNKYNLSVGDSISLQLGDKICHRGTEVIEGKDLPGFGEATELLIVGAYSDFTGELDTIYVPSAILPVEVPDNYEMKPEEFSVFVEDSHDIEAFHKAAEQFAEALDLTLEYSDRGWLDVKDSLGMGALASLLTTVLYVAGAALALFLAVYLYIGRNKKSFAIMRMLGVPGKAAGNSILLPFVTVSILSVPIGGITGLYYAQRTAKKALLGMADSAPAGYVPNAELPISIVILCLSLELLFVSLVAYFFLRNMKHTPPLELLQEGAKYRRGAEAWKAPLEPSSVSFVPTELDMEKIYAAGKGTLKRNYGSVRHVTAYIRRHAARTGKTVVSLVLAVVLAAGIGAFVLARITYQDAFYELGVKCTASDFIFSFAKELSTSSLVKDFYCYDNFGVRVEGEEDNIPMTVTSDFVRSMGDECVVDYAEGYELSAFEGTAQVCLAGREVAEKLNISAGDEIGILADTLYTALKEQGGKEAVSNGYKTYKVIGVIESDDVNIRGGIFTGIRNDLTRLFSMDFAVEHCEFILADNDRLDELQELLQNMEGRSVMYSQNASHHVDSGGLANIERIRGLVESLFPIAVAAAVLIGLFGPLLVILQSAQEAAFLRILGVTKKRARCMLAIEQIVLCIAGIILVAGGLALYDSGRFARGIETFAVCFGLYLLGCVCGAVAASIQVTRHKLLELLQVKE